MTAKCSGKKNDKSSLIFSSAYTEIASSPGPSQRGGRGLGTRLTQRMIRGACWAVLARTHGHV